MLVRLIHEKHGEHIVYTPFELDKCLANGWKVKPEPVPAVEKRRGRPPKDKK